MTIPPLGYLVINLNPIAAQIGPFAIRWYGLAYVLAITIALCATLRYANALGVGRERVWQIFLGAALAGLIGGRLYFDVQQPDFISHYVLEPGNLFAVWNGGMAYFGAIFAAAPTAAILAWRTGLAPWLALDMAALFGAVGQMFGRLGNLVNGDIVGYAAGHPVIPPTLCATAPCVGYVQDPHVLPWATAYLNVGAFVQIRGVPYQPAAAYEIVINLATLALLWPLRLYVPRHVRAGAFFCLYVIGYAVGQWLVFFARSNVFVPFLGIDTLKQAQWTALATILGILLFYGGVVHRWSVPWRYGATTPLPDQPGDSPQSRPVIAVSIPRRRVRPARVYVTRPVSRQALLHRPETQRRSE